MENLTRDEWLDRALAAVSAVGGAKLRINTLVKQVGVSKGSFYWHFKNRADFIAALIDYWHEHYTLKVAEFIDAVEGEARDKLYRLMEMVYLEQLTRHDLAIRTWAVAEPELQPLVQHTDSFRLQYLRTLFKEIGFDEDAADLRSRVFLGEAAWEAALFHSLTGTQRKKQATKFYELLVGETYRG